MSTETTTAVEKKESLFSKKNRKLLTDPLDDSNPITVQVLGICSALAITVQVQQAVIMSLAVLFVMIGGNVIVSLMRNIIPCLLYTSPSPRDSNLSRMPSSA